MIIAYQFESQAITAWGERAYPVGVLEYNLKKQGYSVESALTGSEALRKIASGQVPDLILLDLMLPDI